MGLARWILVGSEVGVGVVPGGLRLLVTGVDDVSTTSGSDFGRSAVYR